MFVLMICSCKSSNNHSCNQLFTGKRTVKLETSQTIFFKHIFCKKSLDYSEKSRDHYISPKTLDVAPLVESTHIHSLLYSKGRQPFGKCVPI